MKLYRTKIPEIAKATIEALMAKGDIEVEPANKEEAEADLAAIMDEFMRRDAAFRNEVKDLMARRRIPYDQYGQTRKQMAEERHHPLGDDVERFLCRQFIENLLISPNIEEVYADDKDLYGRVMEILRAHDVDEREIRDEAIAKVKNVKEGTVDYEIALGDAIREVKKRRGLIKDKPRNRQ